MVRVDAAGDLEAIASELEAAATAELIAQGVAEADITIIARAHLRYDGTDTPLPVVILERRLGADDAVRRDSLSPLAGEIAKLSPAQQGLAKLERGSPRPVKSLALTPLKFR